MKQEDMAVTSQKKIADGIYEMTLKGTLVREIREPGQFVHIRVGGGTGPVAPLLRRPISICSFDPVKEEMTLIYRRGGLGTDQLSLAEPGETVDVLGPLGNGFPADSLSRAGRALVIGGGVGVPPLYGLSRKLVEAGVSVTHILGFRSARDVFYEKQFAELGQTIMTTEDGSAGRKGRVTDILDRVAFDVACTCGPLPMLEAVQARIIDKPLYISMEQRMGCGVGACLACAVQTVNKNDEKGYRRVCCDGPVFKAREVELC